MVVCLSAIDWKPVQGVTFLLPPKTAETGQVSRRKFMDGLFMQISQ